MPHTTNGNAPLPWPDFEAEFYRLLGRLVCAHGRIDFAIGNQLILLGRESKLDVTEFLDPKKKPLSSRLRKLKDLIHKIFKPVDEAWLAEFDVFYEHAFKAVALRNDYVHGLWSWHYREKIGKDMVLVFKPLQWEMAPSGMSEQIMLGLSEFEAQVLDAEHIMEEYKRFIDKYNQYAVMPFKAP